MDGLLNINKPSSYTSHDVVAKVRGLLQEKSIGHLGTLDPMATGVLPLAVGAATRLVEFASGSKEYIATCLLGRQTDSGDITGITMGENNTAHLSESQVREAALKLTHIKEQVPPMVSAVKKNGKKLYELARKGLVVERAPRPVQIVEVEVLGIDLPRVAFRVVCSAGTYVRTLCETLGETLGTGGCMEALQRTRAGNFRLAESVTLEELAKKIGAGKLSQVLLPVQLLVGNWPYLQLDENKLADVRHGKKIKIPEMAGGWVRVLNSGNRLCAVGIVGTVDQENWLKPKKVFGMDGLS